MLRVVTAAVIRRDYTPDRTRRVQSFTLDAFAPLMICRADIDATIYAAGAMRDITRARY